MKYVMVIPLLIMLFYLLSFSRYNWKNNNKLAAIGSAILGITAFTLACFVLFSGNYEL
ncbi:MAG: hypothetical protein ACOX0L_09250 [Natronincolaceae bacterium]|nr:hypothetical protein [Bacillota bacterium]NLK90176.1 hypothetical protein [Clostridiales bacterium]